MINQQQEALVLEHWDKIGTGMNYLRKKLNSVDLEISVFSRNNVDEIHLVASPEAGEGINDSAHSLVKSISAHMDEEGLGKGSLVFIRYFVSDYANQAPVLNGLVEQTRNRLGPCAVSIVQQPPFQGKKIVAWAYLIHDKVNRNQLVLELSGHDTLLRRGTYEHLWSTRMVSMNGSAQSSDQTRNVFNHYTETLEKCGLGLKDNCIRTWLFVKDIDFNYEGVVVARRDHFKEQGMTRDTHFIASTGIEGRHADPKTTMLMDAYAVGGLVPGQIRHLQAPNHLNPTHEYGVTFERGVSVDYGDRRHVFISGTASIDNKGRILHEGNVVRQLDRIMENIAALLNDAETTLDDVAQMIIYLRDLADARSVEGFLVEKYARIPKVLVLAPVCRPGWLIEIECIAIRKLFNDEFSGF